MRSNKAVVIGLGVLTAVVVGMATLAANVGDRTIIGGKCAETRALLCL